jgi:hypothetical protein
VPSFGSSRGTLRNLKAALSLFSRFLLAAKKYDPAADFDAVPPAVLCSELVWREFAAFLLRALKVDGGATETRALSTQKKTVRLLLNEAKRRFGDAAAHSDFFRCLDAGRKGWLSGMEHNVKRRVVERKAAEGGKVVSRATPLYISPHEPRPRACHPRARALRCRGVLLVFGSLLCWRGAPHFRQAATRGS